MKKIIIFVMIAVIVFTSGCSKNSGEENSQSKLSINTTGLPIVDEKITVNMFAVRNALTKSFASLPYFEMLEEKTNIAVEWDDMEGSIASEKKNLLFAGGDLPDAFYGSWVLTTSEVINYGSQKQLIPLEDLIDEYAPTIKSLFEKRPDLKKQLTAPDGHIYALPTIDESDISSNETFLINRKWLEKVGKEIPTTTEEFYEVLKAFKGKDLNGNGKDDEIPFIFRYADHINGISSMFGPFGVINTQSRFMVNDGKLVFVPTEPGYKEAIKYLNKLSKEKLIDNEGFTLNSVSAKQKANPPIAGSMFVWSEYSIEREAAGTDEAEYVAIPPLKGPDGTQLWAKRAFTAVDNIAFAITSKAKNPEALIRWADLQYEKDFSVQAYRGLYDLNIKKLEDGRYEELPDENGNPQTTEYLANCVPGAAALHVLFKDDYIPVKPNNSDINKRKCDQIYAPYLPKEVFSTNALVSKQDNDRLSALSTDINSYIDNMTAKWIMVGGIEDEWDSYISKLKSMGLDEYIAINQKIADSQK